MKVSPESRQSSQQTTPAKTPQSPGTVLRSIKQKYCYALAFTASMGAFFSGYSFGVISPSQDYLTKFVYADQSKDLLYLTVAIVNLGAMTGAFISVKIADKFGRRRGLMVADVIAIISSLTSIVTNIYLLLLSRILLGLVTGLNTVMISLYIAEWIPPEVKGRAGSLNSLGGTLGVLLGYTMGLNMPLNPTNADNNWWKVMFGLASILPAIRTLLLLNVFRSDTPIFLLKRDRIEESQKAFKLIYNEERATSVYKTASNQLARAQSREQLRTLKKLKTQEIKEKQHRLQKHVTGIKDMFSKKKYRKALFVGCSLVFLIELTGYKYIISYATSIFKQSNGGVVDRTPQLFTIYLGIASLFASFTSGSILQKYGRKRILLVGQLSVAIFHFIFLGISNSNPLSPALKFVVIFVMLSYFMTLAPVKSLFLSDILKGPGLSIANCVKNVGGFAITLISPIVTDSMSSSATFGIFAVCCLIGFFFTLFVVKETKGLTYFESLNIYNTTFKAGIPTPKQSTGKTINGKFTFSQAFVTKQIAELSDPSTPRVLQKEGTIFEKEDLENLDGSFISAEVGQDDRDEEEWGMNLEYNGDEVQRNTNLNKQKTAVLQVVQQEIEVLHTEQGFIKDIEGTEMTVRPNHKSSEVTKDEELNQALKNPEDETLTTKPDNLETEP